MRNGRIFECQSPTAARRRLVPHRRVPPRPAPARPLRPLVRAAPPRLDRGRPHPNRGPGQFHRDFVEDTTAPSSRSSSRRWWASALQDRLRRRRGRALAGSPRPPRRPRPTPPLSRRARLRARSTRATRARTRATPSTPSWSAPRTTSPSPPRRRSPRTPAAPGTRSSSTATPASARRTCSTRSPTRSSRRAAGRVAIVSSERYTNDFVAALSKGTMDDFRRKYRECSALLVDDVQFLAGKDKTAEEFFHTFNELHDHHVQIVLSSDRSPEGAEGARRAALLALRVGHARADRGARVRDPRRHPQEEGGGRGDRPARRGHPAPRASTSARTCASSRAPSCASPPSPR